MLFVPGIILLPGRRSKGTVLINVLVEPLSLGLIQILVNLYIALIQVVLIDLSKTHLSVVLIGVLVLLLWNIIGLRWSHSVYLNYLHQDAPQLKLLTTLQIKCVSLLLYFLLLRLIIALVCPGILVHYSCAVVA